MLCILAILVITRLPRRSGPELHPLWPGESVYVTEKLPDIAPWFVSNTVTHIDTHQLWKVNKSGQFYQVDFPSIEALADQTTDLWTKASLLTVAGAQRAGRAEELSRLIFPWARQTRDDLMEETNKPTIKHL
jgi:hypothetical protein